MFPYLFVIITLAIAMVMIYFNNKNTPKPA